MTEEDLIRWLSTVFTRADWQPEALVMVGSGGDDELIPILEDALSVPVFAPAEAQLALARGAALASAQNADVAFADDAHHFTDHADRVQERRPVASRRRQLGQAGPLALLVAGVLTFTISASVAVSLQLAPKRDLATSEPRPAAKTSPEAPAAVTPLQAPVAIPPAPVVEAPPPAEAPPVEVAPAPVYSETPVGIPDAPPGEAVPPEAAAPPLSPEGTPLPPEQPAPLIPPAPVERPGIISRIWTGCTVSAGTRYHPLPRSRHHRHLLPNSRRYRATPRPCCHLPDRHAEYAR